MATSGSKNFELDVAEYIEEAYERCGLEMRTSYDARTIKRSLNILLADWANRGLNQWTIQQNSITMTEGTLSYSLDCAVRSIVLIQTIQLIASAEQNTLIFPIKVPKRDLLNTLLINR